MTKSSLTPIFIVLVIGLVISIPATFYYLLIENRGGMALAGLLAGISSVGMVVFLIIERLIVRQIKSSLKKVWIVEVTLLAILFFAYAFRQPTYYFKVNDNIEWFGVIYNTKKADKKAEYSFPNNKVLQVYKNEILLIDQNEVGNKTMDIRSSGKKWQGYQSKTNSFDINGKEVTCIIYSPYDHTFSANELQLVENAIKEKLK